MLVVSLGYNYGKVPGSDEVIKLGLTYVNVIGIICGNAYGITLGLDVETELGYLDVYFDGSNYGKLECLLLGDSLCYTGGKLLCPDKVIKL